MANTVEEELQGIIERNEKATPAPENKVETPVVDNTTQVEEPAEEVQTSMEETPNEVETTTTTETTQDESQVVQKTWKEILAEQEEQESQNRTIEKAKKLAENPIMKLALEASERGEDWLTIVNSIASVDVDKISDEQLFKNSLQGQKLSEDEVEEAWEDFQSQRDYLKKPLLESEKNKIRQQVEEKRNQFKLGSKQDINYSEVKTKADNSLEALLDKLPNEVEGVKLTTERKAELFKEARRFYATYLDKDKNSIDVGEAFETAFAKLSKNSWKKDIAEKAKSDGRKEAFDKTHNPNANTMVTSSKPKAESREDKELREYMERINQPAKTLVEIKK
jgi:hypothetical protein